MKRRPFNLVGHGAVLGIMGIAILLMGAVVFEGGPDPVIFPPQHIPIAFDHAYHVGSADAAKGTKGEGLDCDFCHDTVGQSVHSSDRNIPGHGACDSCHAEWIGADDKPAPRGECARCHRDLAENKTLTSPMPIEIPAPSIRFPHKSHVDAGVKCVDCHVQVPSKGVATRDDYPTMDRCLACHEQRGISTECKFCHLTLPAGRLKTEFPAGKLEPRRYFGNAVHDADFYGGTPFLRKEIGRSV